MQLAQYIDHTVLKPITTHADIEKLCKEAIENNFAAVCVPPCYVAMCKNLLANSKVKLATVIGFPLGYNNAEIKLEECKLAMQQGANEIDMVINIAALKNGNFAYLENEISLLSGFTEAAGVALKVIIESGILTTEEITLCCDLYNQYPIQYLKTSTGFAEKGASLEAVALFKALLKPTIGIKASGGIRTKTDAEAYIAAGATRIGTSAGVEIVK